MPTAPRTRRTRRCTSTATASQRKLKTEVQGRISDVRALLTSEDSAAIRSAIDELTASVAKIGEQVYASQQQDVPPGDEPPTDAGSSDGDDTVEGQYREV